MSKKYKNSPLTEVVAEFNFIPSFEWNATIPGLLFETIKKDFPTIKQRPGLIGLMVPMKGEQYEKKIEPVELVQFWNKPQSMLVQTGKNILTVNALNPYPTWEKFFPVIKKTFEGFCSLTSPKGLSRISLRYINSFEVPEEKFVFDSVFEFSLPKPSVLEFGLRHFNFHTEFSVNEKDVLALITTNQVPKQPKTKNITFQLEMVMNKFNALQIKNVNKWLEESHSIIIDSFEASLNKKFKATFE